MTGKDEKENKKRKEKKKSAWRLSAEMNMPFQKDGEKIKGDAAKQASFTVLDIGIIGDIALGLGEIVDGVQVELRNVEVMVDTRAQGKQTLLFLWQLVRFLILIAEVREDFTLHLGLADPRLRGLEALRLRGFLHPETLDGTD